MCKPLVGCFVREDDAGVGKRKLNCDGLFTSRESCNCYAPCGTATHGMYVQRQRLYYSTLGLRATATYRQECCLFLFSPVVVKCNVCIHPDPLHHKKKGALRLRCDAKQGGIQDCSWQSASSLLRSSNDCRAPCFWLFSLRSKPRLSQAHYVGLKGWK